MPPPFSEGRSLHLHEDTGNYGRGGYYGTTYNYDFYVNRDASGGPDRNGQAEHYRQLGDHRWSDQQLPWEKERFSRTGYRRLKDRLEAANYLDEGHQG